MKATNQARSAGRQRHGSQKSSKMDSYVGSSGFIIRLSGNLVARRSKPGSGTVWLNHLLQIYKSSSRGPFTSARSQGPHLRAAFAREWADQRASRTEGPCG